MSARRIDQDMAAAAAGILVPAENLSAELRARLRTRYRQLRVMLHSAGLAATYAFVAARACGETGPLAQAYAEAGRGIRRRLTSLHLLSGDPDRLGPKDVMEQIANMPTVQYARASAEVAALAGWLSRLADACYHDSNFSPAGGDGAGGGAVPARAEPAR